MGLHVCDKRCHASQACGDAKQHALLSVCSICGAQPAVHPDKSSARNLCRAPLLTACLLPQDWGARCRAADELQPEDLKDSVAEWLVAQRAAWRAGRLDLEQRLLLQMAGIRSRVSPCCNHVV